MCYNGSPVTFNYEGKTNGCGGSIPIAECRSECIPESIGSNIDTNANHKVTFPDGFTSA